MAALKLGTDLPISCTRDPHPKLIGGCLLLGYKVPTNLARQLRDLKLQYTG